MRETCVVRPLLVILHEEHANQNKKRKAEHYFYLQMSKGLPSESDITYILLTSDSLTRTKQVSAEEKDKDLHSHGCPKIE